MNDYVVDVDVLLLWIDSLEGRRMKRHASPA